jgi:hypothetical protein
MGVGVDHRNRDDPGKGKDIPWVLGASQDGLGRPEVGRTAGAQAAGRCAEGRSAAARRPSAKTISASDLEVAETIAAFCWVTWSI